jgi:hypothetical protein
MTVEEWSLSDEQRADTVERIRANVSSMSFFRGTPLAPEAVAAAATAVEKKAYTVARVEARTTTGVRPHHESLKVRFLRLLFVENPLCRSNTKQHGNPLQFSHTDAPLVS